MQLAGIASTAWRRWGKIAPVIALVSYVCLLGISTHLPPLGLRTVSFDLNLHISDKIAHSGAYGGLTLLVLLVWRTRRKPGLSLRSKAFWVSMLCLAIAGCGLIDESTQPMVGRHFDWFDWLANLCGMTTAVVSSSLLPRLPRMSWLSALTVR